MNRRRFLLGLAGASVALGESRLEVGGAEIDVSFDPTMFDLPEAALLDWVKTAARAVTSYFDKFPVAKASIAIVPGRRPGVSSGRSFGEGGARSRLVVGRNTTAAELKDDWTMTHEMVHFGFPSVEESHHWIEEGSAVYIEPIARAQIGELTPERVWGDMVRDMPQGLPQPGDEGLDNTHTWGRTYWGGAIFCLLADVEIRQRRRDAKGLEDAFRAINRAGGTIEVDWPLERAFKTGDKATGTRTLMEMWERMGPKTVPIDLADLWRQLGVRREDRVVSFDQNAPLAAIRSGICG